MFFIFLVVYFDLSECNFKEPPHLASPTRGEEKSGEKQMLEENRDNLSPAPEENEKPLSTLGAIGLFIFDFIKVFVIAVAIIIPVRYFLFQPFVVTGDSMRPNFQDGNYLIIDEFTYRFVRPPERGEVIVLHAPNSKTDYFIKRVIGLPGDRIVITDGHVEIWNDQYKDGKTLGESYLPNNKLTYGNIDQRLGVNEYFVLGDNRLASSDSRVWGTLARSAIVGRAVLRVFPLPELRAYQAPAY